MGATASFSTRFGAADALRALQERAASQAPGPLSIGIHPSLAGAAQANVRQLPAFDAACGGAEGYLKYVEREIATQRGALGRDERVVRLSCGAGAPAPLAAEHLARLVEIVRGYFAFQPDGDYAVEVEARRAARAVVEALAGLGFNRLQIEASAGASPMQEEELAGAICAARAAGFASVGVGIAPGMLALVRELRPDRVMLREGRADAEALARELAASGYVRMGPCGFALVPRLADTAAPDSADVVAFGVAAISAVGASCFENHNTIEAYCASLDRGQLPVRAGHLLDRDDRGRQEVVRQVAGAFGAVDLAHRSL